MKKIRQGFFLFIPHDRNIPNLAKSVLIIGCGTVHVVIKEPVDPFGHISEDCMTHGSIRVETFLDDQSPFRRAGGQEGEKE